MSTDAEPAPDNADGVQRPVSDYKDNLKLINAELSARLVRQDAAGTQVGTKAALLAGVATAATQFLATRQHLQMTLAVLAWCAYGAAFASAVACYALTKYEDVPDPRDLVEHNVDTTEATTLSALIARRVVAFESNVKRHRKNAFAWWMSVAALAVGLSLSVVAIVQTDHHGRLHPGQPASAQPARAADAGS